MTDFRLSALRALLVGYQPFDEREAGYLKSMLALLDSGASPLSRSSFDPGHFTAGGFVVSPDGSSLLLVHHAKLDSWLQPGGHVEPDDADLESAARREILEEAGLRDLDLIGLLDIDIHLFPKRGQEPAHDHLDVRFGFRTPKWGAAAGDGTVETRWFPVSEVAGWDDRPSLSRPAGKLLPNTKYQVPSTK